MTSCLILIVVDAMCHGERAFPPASATEMLSKMMQQRKCYEIVLTLRDHSIKYPCQPGYNFSIEQAV